MINFLQDIIKSQKQLIIKIKSYYIEGGIY